MNQVRLLAQDFIDIYVYRENPDFHIGRKGSFWRCILWVPWFLKKTVAQRFAAGELEKLKERARDVGERRVRYGVDIPSSSSNPSRLLLALLGSEQQRWRRHLPPPLKASKRKTKTKTVTLMMI
jgi:hypothetical protein